MLRKRDSSTIHALERREKIFAAEYFDNVVHNLNTLREVLEHTNIDHVGGAEHNTFDRDNRSIDFIMVYDKTARRPSKEKVNAFLRHLVSEGFSTEGGESDVFEHLIFIRIHCHRTKLVKAGTILDMNLSFLSEYDETIETNVFLNFNFLFNDVTRPMEKSDISQRAHNITWKRKPVDITNAERLMVAYELLRNTRYGPEVDELGVASLLHKGYLHTIFPLHDGLWQWTDEGHINERQVLMKYWALNSNWYKLQPINLIKRYFGCEVAFYFAFLGFFNKMLIIPAIIGVISVFYGILTFGDDRNYKTKAICSSEVMICPPCHDMAICHFERLNNECHTSIMAYVFDNFATAVYSLFWCFWGTVIYAKWKRRETVLMFRWNLMEMENEVNIRPQYLGRAMRHRSQKQMGENERSDYVYLSTENQRREVTWLRVLRYCASGLVITTLILLILFVIYLAVVIRWWTGKIIGRFDGQFSFQWRIFLVTTIGNTFIILFVCIAEELFRPLAHFVTDFENPRTQEEYEQAYVYKYAVLCFITSYSFIAYTAFLKGRFFTYPGHELQYYILGNLNYDLEKIHTPMLSVTYQWILMTIGKELWRLIILSINPRWRRKQKTRDFKERASRIWEEEYQLHAHDYPFLMEENMKIILQYGYLILFPGANPLGPLAYFCYNLWALRYEARRALIHTRRSIPSRIAGFGPWLKLIKMLTVVGLGTNVFLMAFTSNLVPELAHWFNPYYVDYISYTFSEFAINDYPANFGADIKKGREGAKCFYKGNRSPPSSPKKYFNTVVHWNKIANQFLTVAIVQCSAIIFCGLILFVMSDTPHYIKESLTHRSHQKQQEREEKFRREQGMRSTINPELRHNFTVIGI